MLRKATLYNYFKSKEELYLNVLRNEMNCSIQEVEKAIEENSSESKKWYYILL